MGNTLPGLGWRSLLPVHPHTHGEHLAGTNHFVVYDGSSPHAWGTRPSSVRRPRHTRFIPTRMGNTTTSGRSGSDLSVHPHTHGEHCSLRDSWERSTGSSPHAWGTPRWKEPGRDYSRFIPTRMGNTFYLEDTAEGIPVHPHTHGEHQTTGVYILMYYGSSPHAWGTPPSSRANSPCARFIPTRMGNTASGTGWMTP